jgi:hypothetical protein
VALLKRRLADSVLLGVMGAAQAHCPLVGRLEPLPAVGRAANMRALDRTCEAARNLAAVPPDPGVVRTTRAHHFWRAQAGPARRQANASPWVPPLAR